MDGIQYSDNSHVSAFEDTYDWLFQEDGDESDMEITIPPDYAALDSTLRSQRVEGANQDESSQFCQPSTSLQPSELPATTETLLQNQDHLERALMNNVPQNPQFRTYHPALVPEGVLSPEVDALTSVASTAAQQDMEHQSRYQQFCSELSIIPFPLPLPHMSMAMQNPHPLTIPEKEPGNEIQIPEERNQSSREALAEIQSIEPNPQQMSRLEEMQKLTETFSKIRNILGFSRKDIRLVLMKLSGKYIIPDLMNLFDNFNVLFANMCHFMSLLELFQKDFEASPTPSYSLRNTRTNDTVSSDRSASTTGENMGDEMSKETSDDSDDAMIEHLHNENLIGEDDDNQAEPAESLNSTVLGNCKWTTNKQAVPRRSTGNNHTRYTAQQSNDMTEWIPSLLFPDMVSACQFFQSQPKPMISLEKMQEFVRKFRMWRKALPCFPQGKVVSELKGRYRIQMAKQCLKQFENFNENFERMYEMKPATEEWLKDIHISETQGPIFGTPLQTLQSTFRENPNPNAEVISNLAESVNLDNEFVTLWFQKRRQIQECINSPTPTSTVKDKKNISQGLVERQSTESNPPQICSLEDMQKLTENFSKMRSILGFSQKDIRLVLMKLSGKYIMPKLMKLFDDFSVLFANMCHFKSLLELLQKDFETSPTDSCSLRNKSNTRASDTVSNDRPASTTGENMGDEMTKEKSDDSDDVMSGHLHNENLTDDDNQEDFEESVNSTISRNCEFTTSKQAARSSFTVNSYSRYTAPQFSDMTEWIPSLLYPDLARALQFLQSQPKEMISLEEMQEFVRNFKKWRRGLDITQDVVISELKKRYRIQMANRCIEQFENFNEYFDRMYEMKPATEEWLKDIHISETQGPIFGTPLQTLQENFRQNQDPNAEVISNLAKSVNLDNEFVTLWFQKRRQIQECINSPTPTSTKKYKENISPVS